MHWEMENEEPSPVKLINRRCLEIKPYNWLICGKRAGKENLRRLGEKGMQWCDMDLMLYNFVIDFCSMTKLYLVMSCHSWSDMHLNHTFFVLWLFSSLNDLFFFFIVIDTCEEKIVL